MNALKRIQLSIDVAKAALAGGGCDPSMFSGWCRTAENNLALALGQNWQESLYWEGASTIRLHTSIADVESRLRRSIGYLEGALKYADDSEPAKPVISRQPEQESPLDHWQPVPRDQVQTFIVHGHDGHAKLDLKNFLQNTLKLPEPIILQERAERGKTIIEKFEEHASTATFVFVLLTPDDELAQQSTWLPDRYRARQNVIFEMGYFFAKLGRGRVVLLYKGDLDLPSDINGLIYIDIQNGIEAVGEKIRREMAAHVQF